MDFRKIIHCCEVNFIITTNVFFIDINFKNLGGNIEAIAAIRLQPYSEQIVNKLRDDLLKLPEIISLYHMGGNYDYLIHMSVKNSEHLLTFS